MSAGVRVFVMPVTVEPSVVSAALFAAGAEALQELDGAFVTNVATDERAQVLIAAALAADPEASVGAEPTPDIDWSSAWRSQLRAHTVGYLTVTPPWLAAPFLPERRIVIDPAMAFGTGDHATTRGVLTLMQDVVRHGDTVADLGAGSAVLAIGAAKLGAMRVVAIENDPDAIGNAEENVAVNDVASRVTVIEGDAGLLLPLVAPVRVVLANIVSGVIQELLPTIVASLTPDGVAIFSGMRTSEREMMMGHVRAAGLVPGAEYSEGEWWTVACSRA